MFKLPSRRLGLATIVAAGVLAPILVAYAIPPFRGIRPNDAGQITEFGITYASQNTTGWARTFADDENPNILRVGGVTLYGREWRHRYTQAQCPAGYNILGNGTVDITERAWLFPIDRMNPNFNEAWFSYGGTFSHTINNRVEEPIQGRPEVEMNNVQFRVVNGVTYWQSNILSRDAFLVSTRKVVNTAGTQWRDASTRDPRSATASRVVNGTRSTVDICSTGVQQGCGNSTLEPTLGEQCDDGNTTEGDGCNGACVIEYCGNEYWEESRGEECDDGNGVGGDGCSATCHIEYCGDGIVQSGLDETCDDGNGENGDGCSTLCTIEVPESSSSSSSFSSSMSSSSFSSSFSSGMSSSWSSSF